MGLYFHNKTNVTLQIVYAHSDPKCEGDKWIKKGWYKVAPGKTVKVWSGWAGGKKFFYYAEDTRGLGHVWSGDFFTQIPYNAFSWCWNTGSTDSRTLGLKKIKISTTIMDHTINLKF